MSSRANLTLLITALTLFAFAALAGAAGGGKIRNGGFEAGKLSSWEHARNGPGHWQTYRGRALPNSGPAPRALRGGPPRFYKPPEGKFGARSIQGYISAQVLYRNLRVPEAGPGEKVRLVLYGYYKNFAAGFASPPTLEVGDDKLDPPNQQYRIDLMKPGAPAFSLEPGDLLKNIFRTRPGDPRRMRPTLISTNVTDFEGKRIRLRMATAVTESPLIGGVDAVRFRVTD